MSARTGDLRLFRLGVSLIIAVVVVVMVKGIVILDDVRLGLFVKGLDMLGITDVGLLVRRGGLVG